MVSKSEKKDIAVIGGVGLGAAVLYFLSKKKTEELPKEENYSKETVPIVSNYNSAPTPISISLPALSDFIKMNSTEINKLVSDIELQLATDISSKVDTSLIPEIEQYELSITALEKAITEATNNLSTYDNAISSALTNRNSKQSTYNSFKSSYLIYRNYVLKYQNSINKSQAYYKANQTAIELWAYWKLSADDYKKTIEYDSNYMSGQFEQSIKDRDVYNFWTNQQEGINKSEYFDLEDILQEWLKTYTTTMDNEETKMINAESEYNIAQRAYNSAVEAKTSYYNNNIQDKSLQLIALQNQLSQLKNSLYVSLTVLKGA